MADVIHAHLVNANIDVLTRTGLQLAGLSVRFEVAVYGTL